MLNNENTPMKINHPGFCTVKELSPYTKPFLEEIGDLRSITLGGTGGQLESGGGGLYEPFEMENWYNPGNGM